MMRKKIGVIGGSLRKASWSKQLARAILKIAPANLNMEIIDISQLPIYNQDPDDEGHPYQEWQAFREKTKNMDGILFITPEYNRSIPAPMKNAIDVGSRPYGKSVWTKKPCAVISTSPGVIGGFGANQHLRQCFVFLDLLCMQQPEAYLGQINQLMNEKDEIINDKMKEFLEKFLSDFEKWVNKILS
jgi:chromate reductase